MKDQQVEQFKELINFISTLNIKEKIYYLIFPIIYLIFTIYFLFKIIDSPKEIIESTSISFIIDVYFKDKFDTIITLIGFTGAFTLLIGYISLENEETIFGKEGKLFSGISFLHNNLIKISTLILLVVFTITYYEYTPLNEFYAFIGLYILFLLIGTHWKFNMLSSYDWNMLEYHKYRIYYNKIFSILAFNLVFIFYIFTLPYVKTLTFNFLNIWMLFMSTLVFAALKSPAKRVIIQYLDNKEEYAHLVRIENGFARLITKNCASKQVNLSEIKRINYDNNYIEDFRQNWKRTHPWNK